MPTLIDEREYPSTRRDSDKKYLCKKWADGTYSCDCPGWRFKQPDKPRYCSHCGWFAQDYWLVTIPESMKLATSGIKFDIITTYTRTLYLIKQYRTVPVNTPAVTRPLTAKQEQANRGGRSFADIMREAQAARGVVPEPVKPIKPTVPITKPGRARLAWDEEV